MLQKLLDLGLNLICAGLIKRDTTRIGFNGLG